MGFRKYFTSLFLHFLCNCRDNTGTNPVGKDIERRVIVPTRFKDIYDQQFFSLYSHFLAALGSASTLIVLGHSLRDEYLRAGIIERFRKGNFRLIVIDPEFPKELPEELKPARAGRNGGVTHIPLKIEEFSDELASIVSDATPVNLPAQCAAIVHHMKSKTNKIRIKGNIGILKPGQTKMFKAVLDVYLMPGEKPALVRAWLAAEFTTPEGQKKSEFSEKFHDRGKALVGSGLTGMIQEEVALNIEIPEYSEWLKHAEKVTLKVALVRKSVAKPAQAKGNRLIAIAERKLTYTT